MPYQKPRWRIEVQESTYPREVWTPLRYESGKVYGFVEKADAETQKAKLLRVQPHAKLRIAAA